MHEPTNIEASSRTAEEFLKGIWKENPVFVAVLGMCPVLAVTNTAINSLAMGLATTFVLVFSSLLVSSFRKLIPKQVRITSFIIIIATFVTVVDFMLAALVPDIHKELGALVIRLPEGHDGIGNSGIGKSPGKAHDSFSSLYASLSGIASR